MAMASIGHVHSHRSFIITRCLNRQHLLPLIRTSIQRTTSFSSATVATTPISSDHLDFRSSSSLSSQRRSSSSKIMKLPLSPFLAALSLTPSPSHVIAFQTNSLSRAFVHKSASSTRDHGASKQLMHQRRMLSSSSSSALSMAETLDAMTAASTAPVSGFNSPSDVTEAEGEVLSVLQYSSSSSFAVVKLCEEDLIQQLPSSISASGAGVSGNSADGSVPLIGEDGDKVELADALFGKSMPAQQQQKAAAKENGAMADGDLTGRTVTFSNAATGVVVAHRHPIAFVLIDSSEEVPSTQAGNGGNMCSISTKLVSLDPSSIPPGSVVDYLGRHVSLLNDGSVSRALPKAPQQAAVGEAMIDMTNGVGIGNANGISLTVNGDGSVSSESNTATKNGRPIFVPIPKISEIGLIDSPLVTGITAIDALTPIGKGQNMLVIGEAEKIENGEMTGVNKRGWMINLLRNVVENHRGGDMGMRCFYGLTSADHNVRSHVLNGIKEAGIEDDIVTVISGSDSTVVKESQVTEAAEAVAIAAAACTLGEHHALNTGGDAVVIIDDINLHKSLWDITTQELVRVYGVDAVVKADLQGGSSSEMRGYFSGLIQRAARFNAKKGGGSVTLILLSTLPNPDDETNNTNGEEEEQIFEASDFDTMSEKIKARIGMLVKANVPLTPTNLSKIQIPVPRPSATEDAKRLALQHVEDLISMSDGQIWLDADLVRREGRSPPLDPSRSITRVGVGADTQTCRADAPALRSVVGSLRFEFQQAMDVLDSTNTALSVSAGDSTFKQVRRRDAFLLAMHQEPREVRKLSQECIALLAAFRGHLDGVLADGGMPGTLKGKEAINGLFGYVEKEAGNIVQSIDATLDLSLEERSVLEEAIAAYFL